MSNGAQMLQTLREHRPLLLACEAIGWLHMTGKAHPDFLRHHGGTGVNYDDRKWLSSIGPPFPWVEKLTWIKGAGLSSHWPSTLTDFVTKHRERQGSGVLALLQAAHGMASGIEKNVPRPTSEYLNQDTTHMWLASPFGHPVRNLLADPPQLLTEQGWRDLLARIERLLDDLQKLGSPEPPHTANDLDRWWQWREGAIGRNGWLRQAFLSSLAETCLPNNDVTLWDQSYVAAALFKAAVAGAVLAGNAFTWDDKLKQQTRWRVLTVGFGTRHYEARAVKIGDWAGAQRGIEKFFGDVRRFIEVDLAVGSLVYRDDETLAFTFPGERADGAGGLTEDAATQLKDAIGQQIAQLAADAKFETPPVCQLSCSTRSFVPMVRELREARETLAIPVHRKWVINATGSLGQTSARHVCPVCLVRFNAPPSTASTDNARKSCPCAVCRERRHGRLGAWLAGEADTIWISEVADANDRVALLSLSFDLDPWLEGEHVDSLRAQSVADWRRFNPVLQNKDNPIDPRTPRESLFGYIESKLGAFDQSDAVLRSLQEGYQHESHWEAFFQKIVEDRADGPRWQDLDGTSRAQWLGHQLFRKLPSPGRVYRFWRTAEGFFEELLAQFRDLVSSHSNRWRTRRLLIRPDPSTSAGGWEDGETYLGHWRGAPFEVVYLEDRKAFLTICNLARCFQPEETKEALVQETEQQAIRVKGEDGEERELRGKVPSSPENLGVYAPVIPLDLSPRRFRVLVPLDRATTCIETAIAKWRDELARVWDRMPLRIGVVAFPRLTPFQAVIEAARNLEDALAQDLEKTWRVVECRTREGVTALLLEHQEGRSGSGVRRELVQAPTRLRDGRPDVFYPYVQVEDRALRSPRDFRHPDGRVYRHMDDLRPGDGVVVHPSRIAAVFLDSAARRFEPAIVYPLADFERMRAVWDLLTRKSPSLSALRGAWSELEERSRSWRDSDGRWLPGAETEWLDLVRALLQDRLGVSGSVLETLVEAVGQGTLGWALEWHLTWLKEGVEGAKT